MSPRPFISEERVRAALRGPHGEVLRTLAAQPYRSTHSKHLVDPSTTIPVVRP